MEGEENTAMQAPQGAEAVQATPADIVLTKSETSDAEANSRSAPEDVEAASASPSPNDEIPENIQSAEDAAEEPAAAEEEGSKQEEEMNSNEEAQPTTTTAPADEDMGAPAEENLSDHAPGTASDSDEELAHDVPPPPAQKQDARGQHQQQQQNPQPPVIVVRATEAYAEPSSPLSPQHSANRTLGPLEDISLSNDEPRSPATTAAPVSASAPASTTRRLPNLPTQTVTPTQAQSQSARAAPAATTQAPPPTTTTTATTTQSKSASSSPAVSLPRMAPPARTHNIPQTGPPPPTLAAAQRAPGLGVVIVGKPAQASAARKKLATGFLHNLKYEYYLGRARLQGHVPTPATAAEDAAMAQQMETLKSVDTCYVRLSEIASNYKKSMDEFKEAELALAKFLDESAMRDATPVGDVMRSLAAAMKGQASHHTAKLATPMTSLVDDFRTFNTRVVADTATTIERMDRARLESDAYNLWFKDVEGERAKNTERFQTVQQHTAHAQQTYDRLRHDCMTKIMMVGDHRLRLTSTTLRRYHGALASHYAHSADLFRTAVVRHKDMAGADSFKAILAEG